MQGDKARKRDPLPHWARMLTPRTLLDTSKHDRPAVAQDAGTSGSAAGTASIGNPLEAGGGRGKGSKGELKKAPDVVR